MNQNAKTPLIIEPATRKDLVEITPIYAEAVLHGTASFELQPPDLAEMTRRWEKLVSGGYPYLITRIENQIAGYAYAGPFHTRPGYNWSVENTVYVNPQFHQMGVGTALLAQLINICTNNGYRQMIAVIGDSANTGSIRLHENMGFTLIGLHKSVGRKFDRWLDSVLMQKALGDGDGNAPGSS